MDNTSGIGVMGSANEERSVEDNLLQSDFGCVREGYVSGEMIEPRTEYDMIMLRQFGGGCNESYDSLQAKRKARERRENYCPMSMRQACPGRCGCMGGCGCANCPYRVRENYGIGLSNGNPYNTSSNVRYLPLR